MKKMKLKLVKPELLVPNPWNPNRMPQALFTKLVTNLERHRKAGREVPPVVVRPHPTEAGKYEIIDGFHRWKAFKQMKCETVHVFVMDVDDAEARVLTGNLNYLRGEKDPQRYTNMVGDLLQKGFTTTALSEILPESSAELEDLITAYGEGEAIRKLLDEVEAERAKERESNPLADENVFVDVTFHVSVAQMRVINQEVKRVAKAIGGSNAEGRALEFIAVQSSQNELPHDLVAGAPAPGVKDDLPPESELVPLEETTAEKLRRRQRARRPAPISSIETKLKEHVS